MAPSDMATRTAPDERVERDDARDHDLAPDVPYHVLLWNDPVTLMDMVVRALVQVLGLPAETAERLMLTAHREGKAVVWTGERDRATRYCLELGLRGLQSTIARG